MYISKLKEPKQYPTIFFGRYTIPNSVKPFEIHISHVSAPPSCKGYKRIHRRDAQTHHTFCRAP